jgi:prepilin-type N-terminal cleavage/methylation domain-containing protein
MELRSITTNYNELPVTINYRRCGGFTLIEISVVIAIIGLMLSVALPVSYSMYKSYQTSLEAEKVLTFISGLKREAFLYGTERRIETNEGLILLDGQERKELSHMKIESEKPIMIFNNGTTTGGSLKVTIDSYGYRIELSEPHGDLKLVRGL